MKVLGPFLCASFGACLLLGTWAHGASSYGVSASNVTMPASGTGQSKYTASGIPMAGNLAVSCTYSGPQTEAHLPVCDGGPAEVIPVTAGQTVNGTVIFYPYGSAVPAVNREQATGQGLAAAAALLLGLGLRRSRRRLLAMVLLGVCGLAGALALTACGGSANGSTPGTYQYTIAATVSGTGTTLTAQTTTTISVTVP